MAIQGYEKWAGDQEVREGLYLADHRSNSRVLSIDRTQGAEKKETLESILSSALRSEDPELDEILSAIEEISVGLKSGAPNSRRVDNALMRAASCALKQSLL